MFVANHHRYIDWHESSETSCFPFLVHDLMKLYELDCEEFRDRLNSFICLHICGIPSPARQQKKLFTTSTRHQLLFRRFSRSIEHESYAERTRGDCSWLNALVGEKAEGMTPQYPFLVGNSIFNQSQTSLTRTFLFRNVHFYGETGKEFFVQRKTFKESESFKFKMRSRLRLPVYWSKSDVNWRLKDWLCF